jgi:hypothetical protein
MWIGSNVTSRREASYDRIVRTWQLLRRVGMGTRPTDPRRAMLLPNPGLVPAATPERQSGLVGLVSQG